MELADFKATGDQTSKRSDKQYKYEEKMCGWLTLKLPLCRVGGMEDTRVLGTRAPARVGSSPTPGTISRSLTLKRTR